MSNVFDPITNQPQGELFPMTCQWPNHTGKPAPAVQRTRYPWAAVPICRQCLLVLAVERIALDTEAKVFISVNKDLEHKHSIEEINNHDK